MAPITSPFIAPQLMSRGGPAIPPNYTDYAPWPPTTHEPSISIQAGSTAFALVMIWASFVTGCGLCFIWVKINLWFVAWRLNDGRAEHARWYRSHRGFGSHRRPSRAYYRLRFQTRRADMGRWIRSQWAKAVLRWRTVWGFEPLQETEPATTWFSGTSRTPGRATQGSDRTMLAAPQPGSSQPLLAGGYNVLGPWPTII